MSELLAAFAGALTSAIPYRGMPPSWCERCFCKLKTYDGGKTSCRHCGWKWDQQ